MVVFAMALLALAIMLCPGCRKRQIPPVGPDEGIMEAVDTELLLPSELPTFDQFKEPGEVLSPEDTELFQDIHFDFDRSDIRPVDRPILGGIADCLKAKPDIYLLIEGHCDERGTSEYNVALGERRALSTRAFLAELGLDGDRMVTITLGEEDPIDPGHTEEAWDENRRAHFKVWIKGEEAAEVAE